MKCLILSQPYKDKNSTGLFEPPKVAVGGFSITRHGQDQNKWQVVEDNDIKSMFIDHVNFEINQSDNNKTDYTSGQIRLYDESESEIKDQVDQDGEVDSSRETQPHEVASSESVKRESSRTSSPSSELKMFHDQLLSDTNPIDDSKSDNALMDLLKILEKTESRTDKVNLNREWLYFIDSGGQIQFQQILQAFIPGVTVLMLVINLAEDLSSPANCEYHKDGKIYMKSKYSISVKTLLKRLIRMVKFSNFHQQIPLAISTSDENCLFKHPNLKIITIATHRDELEEKGEISKISNINSQLAEIYKPVEENLQYGKICPKQIFYEVDGRKALSENFDNKVIKTISDTLSRQALEVNIPIRWYGYEILLREKASESCGVLRLGKCMSLGTDLHMKTGEVESALELFYLLNSILLYPKEVSELVFINPNSLIQVINQLMCLVCQIRNGEYGGDGEFALLKLANLGIISRDVLSREALNIYTQISNEFDEFKTDLFKIFIHLLIAAELPVKKPSDDKQYFMPALLPLINSSSALDFIPFETSKSSPLLFYFSKGAPIGLFCALIVTLLSVIIEDDKKRYKKNLWIIPESTEIIYSNFIVLQNQQLGVKVVLVESLDWFEIYCEDPQDQFDVKEFIEDSLFDAAKNRKLEKEIESELDIAFFCPCSKQSQPHLAEIKEKNSKLVCKSSGEVVNDTEGFPRTSWMKKNSGINYYIIL